MLRDYNEELIEELKKCESYFESAINTEYKGYLENILKKTIYIKHLEDKITENKKHYYESMVYNILLSLKCIDKLNEHFYYMVMRSYIENFIRFCLKLENLDDSSVTKIFKDFKKIVNNYNFFEKKYSVCCNYVHSNIKAKLDISLYLEDIDKSINREIKSKLELIKDFDNVIKESIMVINDVYERELNIAFHRKNEYRKNLLKNYV